MVMCEREAISPPPISFGIVILPVQSQLPTELLNALVSASAGFGGPCCIVAPAGAEVPDVEPDAEPVVPDVEPVVPDAEPVPDAAPVLPDVADPVEPAVPEPE